MWDHRQPPSCRISDQVTNNTPAHNTIAGGDLVVVQRSIPRTAAVAFGRADRHRGRRVLLGARWVTHVHRRWQTGYGRRRLTDVWHVPLVTFDVRVRVDIIRRHRELAQLHPFTREARHEGLVGTTPVEAAALVAACGLPSWVLTDSDPVDIARRLAGLRTGMLEEDLKYERDARSQYEYIHAIDAAATAGSATSSPTPDGMS